MVHANGDDQGNINKIILERLSRLEDVVGESPTKVQQIPKPLTSSSKCTGHFYAEICHESKAIIL